jgi:hypothetical protein
MNAELIFLVCFNLRSCSLDGMDMIEIAGAISKVVMAENPIGSGFAQALSCRCL